MKSELEERLSHVPKKDWAYLLTRPEHSPGVHFKTCIRPHLVDMLKPFTVKVNCHRARHSITAYSNGKLVLHGHSKRTKDADSALSFFGTKCRCFEVRDAWRALMKNPNSYEYKALPAKLVQYARSRAEFMKHKRDMQKKDRRIVLKPGVAGCASLSSRLAQRDLEYFRTAYKRCLTKDIRGSFMEKTRIMGHRPGSDCEFTRHLWRTTVYRNGLHTALFELPLEWSDSYAWKAERWVPCFITSAYMINAERASVSLAAFGWNSAHFSTPPKSLRDWTADRFTVHAEARLIQASDAIRSLRSPEHGNALRWSVKLDSATLRSFEHSGVGCFVSEQAFLYYARFWSPDRMKPFQFGLDTDDRNSRYQDKSIEHQISKYR